MGGINKVHYGLCENGEYLKDTLQFSFLGFTPRIPDRKR